LVPCSIIFIKKEKGKKVMNTSITKKITSIKTIQVEDDELRHILCKHLGLNPDLASITIFNDYARSVTVTETTELLENIR
jgi:hypothetical protein